MTVQTAVIRATDQSPDPDVFDRIGQVLAAGGTVVYPTETFYALGVAADMVVAIEKIYLLKERDRGKPLSIVVADQAMAEGWIQDPPVLFTILARELWPGPLTLVVKARTGFPPAMLGPGGSIAMRVPGSAWLRAFIAHFGRPVTATSANISGEKEIADGDDAVRMFTGKADLIVDGGTTPGGLASTIVDLTSAPPRIVRAGAVPSEALQSFLSAG
jgi:tRNA threonylcarbamoyl adenosine modification protein (Sua5/YciO/YrdC/YwlC family)